VNSQAKKIRSHIQSPHGDCRTEFVTIGCDMDKAALTHE
jgi:hypothetical protein